MWIFYLNVIDQAVFADDPISYIELANTDNLHPMPKFLFTLYSEKVRMLSAAR